MKKKGKENDFRKLNRLQILELFLQEKEKNEKLEQEVTELRAQLEEKNLELATAGSMAEAALKLNGVFEAADKAAEQYLESIREIGRKKIMLCRCELESDGSDE